MYYDTILCKAIDEATVKLRGLENVSSDMLRSLGIYPLIHADASDCNPYTQYFTMQYVPFGDSYMGRPEVHDIVDPARLTDLLQQFKMQRRKAFTAAFDALEKRALRPQAAVLEALLTGDAPPEADADFLWQMEAIKQENRCLLAQLNAADSWYEAHTVQPWLPWPVDTKEDCICA